MSTLADETAGPLAEFAALRAEIERRATIQWHVLALQIAIAGAVFGFALSAPRREILLLVIPIATYMTFGRYVTQAASTHLIGRYIRTELTSRVPGGLRWEEWRLKNAPTAEMGIFARIHFAGVVFPGVSTLAIGAFVLAATTNGLAHDQNGVVIASVIAVVLGETALTSVIVLTLWRLRHYATNSPG
jgi:hypothetical protein